MNNLIEYADVNSVGVLITFHYSGVSYLFRGYTGIEETERGELIIRYGKKKIKFPKGRDEKRESFTWELVI